MYEAVSRIELPIKWYSELAEYAQKEKIIFLSTPFDEEKVDLLEKINVPAFKVASGDLTCYSFLKYIAQKKKPIILSTGMATLEEVKKAIKIVNSVGNREIILLHCVSNYPSKLKDANIRAMVTMQNTFNLPVGYSDHSPGYIVPLGAVALGASVIEKHITFNRNLKGPDHPFALEVEEFSEMIKKIRELEKALGDGKKRPVLEELPERKFARRGLYAKSDISKGVILKEEMIKMVRPSYENSPRDIQEVIDKKAIMEIVKDESITLEKIQTQ